MDDYYTVDPENPLRDERGRLLCGHGHMVCFDCGSPFRSPDGRKRCLHGDSTCKYCGVVHRAEDPECPCAWCSLVKALAVAKVRQREAEEKDAQAKLLRELPERVERLETALASALARIEALEGRL